MFKCNTQELKSILKINDCELEALRAEEKIAFDVCAHEYSYRLPEEQDLIGKKLNAELINWHLKKHSYMELNEPQALKSVKALEGLAYKLLLPIYSNLGKPIITYGFTTQKLKSVIQKNSPNGTAPSLDQHSAYEVNSKGNQICSRGGAACDFYIEGVAASDIVRYIVNNLSYDRIYFYGNDRPIHVSFHLESLQHHLQVMGIGDSGRRYPASKAFGEDAKHLAEKL